MAEYHKYITLKDQFIPRIHQVPTRALCSSLRVQMAWKVSREEWHKENNSLMLACPDIGKKEPSRWVYLFFDLPEIC